ncbi:MAG TPA: peptidylprolyl isomerase [Ignavibacteria bacterium]
MGLMNKLRDKTHIILIVLVIAFLGTIVFEWGMDYLGMRGGQTMELGMVNGQEISAKEYDDQVQFYIEQQRKQTGEDPDDNMIQMLKNQIWDQFVSQKLIEQEIKKIGIQVTNQEIINWVYNSPQTLPDEIKKNFIDSTGQFNMGFYQQVLATKTPEIQQFWANVEQYLKQRLLMQKLESVITGTVRVTEGELLQKYKDDNIVASFNFVFLDASSIPDNQVQISEEELKAYYDKHKEDYKREKSAKLKYVIFSDAATIDDSLTTEKQLRALVKDLKRLDPNDSTTFAVVNDNSSVKFVNKFSKPNEFSTEVTNFLFTAKKDSISDVIKASDGYSIVRLVDSKEGSDVFVKASHILVNFGTDTVAAKSKADQILARINKGEDFSKLAGDLSDDPGTKVKGGDLGWFTKGAMVKEFEEAAMNAPLGSVVGPIKSQFGYHIIKVFDRQKKEFKAAVIKKAVKPSTRSKDIARKKAEDFTFIARKGNFEEEAKKINMPVLDIPVVSKGSFIPGIGNNSTVIKFALDEGKGAISDPIKLQNGYAVYYIVEKLPEGYMGFEEVKALVNSKVLLEKKLDMLKIQAQDLKTKISGNDLNSLKAVNSSITIQSADSVSVSKPNGMIGNDFDFNSIVYKMTGGQISEPIRTQKGYYLVQMRSITSFDQAKFAQESDKLRTELLAQKKQSAFQDWLADLKEKAVIVDNRDKFGR